MSSTATQTASQVQPKTSSKDVPWWHEEIRDFSPACRELFENYSHIPPEEVVPHVLAIREKAWTYQPYPCIGMFKFLNLSISDLPCYPRIVALLKSPQSKHTLLDLGCCFAQDIRKLVHDGVPSEKLYGCDMEQEFLDLSYELFKDKETLQAHFFIANALKEDDAAWDEMRGKFDFVYAGSFFHLFGWDDQLKICKGVIRLLKPQKGSMVFGRQTGNLKGQEIKPTPGLSVSNKPTAWRHDVDSFRRLWDTAGEETGTKWETWGMLDEGEGMGPSTFAEKGFKRLRFEVVRVE